MSQYADSNFLVGGQSEAVADEVADGAAARQLLQFRGKFDTFRNHDNRKPFAISFTLAYVMAQFIESEGDFGDQDDVRAAGDARLKRDPSGIATHDLNHHHPMVRLCRGVN